MKTNKSVFTYINIFAAAILVFVGGIFAGQTDFVQMLFANSSHSPSGSSSSDYNSVWNLIHTQYFNKDVSDSSLVSASISGMVDSLNDPATLYLDPKQTQSFNEASSGNTFAGIGIELGYKNDQVIVQRILTDSPSLNSGLKQGDAIISVDGKQTSGEDISTVADNIRGSAGSTVDLTVKHIGESSTSDLKIKREPIHVDSMYVTKTNDANGNPIDELVVTRFTDDSLSTWESKWDNSVSQIQQDNPKGLIIDLRGNPGGFFDAAVYALSDFLPKNTLAAMQENRDGSKSRFYTQNDPRLSGISIMVLVNANTASAAEIFSGAMQYYKKATIIGTNTYGKGTAQQVFTFTDGSTLHLTTNHWLLPSGKWIQKTDPIHPDVSVDYSNNDFLKGNDPQIQSALNKL